MGIRCPEVEISDFVSAIGAHTQMNNPAYGSRTACIYIASAFSVKILYKFIDYIWNTDFLLSHIEDGILWSLCVTIITIFTFGSKKISDTYLNVNIKLGDLLMKSGD